jgi:hypothetical protein
LNTTAALYKVRKICFILLAPQTVLPRATFRVLCLAIWECEGTSIARALEQYFCSTAYHRKAYGANASHFLVGAARAILNRPRSFLCSFVAVFILYSGRFPSPVCSQFASFAVIWYRYNYKDRRELISSILSYWTWGWQYLAGSQFF